MPVGATSEGMAWPSQIFDLVENWFSDCAQEAKRMDVREARAALIERYIKTVHAAPSDALARLFAIPRTELISLLDEMAQTKRIKLQDGWVWR